ncbi:hypothetical protein FOIG_16249 [Fusarium odoratissimum NRRL 54006]|uniref:Uncharacterized protein n=1 Tax=Fusarium odoratissimum (strain NRRL 54006) TaxID=1089451 RepID=X0INN5_FUSO5|nr:uncharacterized protein FOIG_16249 [Fusarium odoratissimum NRRL 54006]EXL90528.1 hypothetical protein FOIG_16249 [Fusarium odoratissimum NRRL 54006]
MVVSGSHLGYYHIMSTEPSTIILQAHAQGLRVFFRSRRPSICLWIYSNTQQSKSEYAAT